MDVLETIVGKRRMDFVFEPEELLVSEVRFYYEGSVWRKFRLSDYTEINGIKMPKKIAEGVEYWDHFNGLKYPEDIKIMLNVDYDPELFTHPTKATTADAWRRKP